MKDPMRPTAPQVELIDCDDHVPTGGSRVLALTLGNILVPTIWASDSTKYFVAWAAYPKVPKSVKLKLQGQYK